MRRSAELRATGSSAIAARNRPRTAARRSVMSCGRIRSIAVLYSPFGIRSRIGASDTHETIWSYRLVGHREPRRGGRRRKSAIRPKGSWSGYWGRAMHPSARILLLLDWRDHQIDGVDQPRPEAVPIDKAELDVATWTLKLEAKMPLGRRRQRHHSSPPASSSNLGSWTNRTYSGTYVFGDERGRSP